LEKQLSFTLNNTAWSYVENEKSESVKSYESLLNSTEFLELKKVIDETNVSYQKSNKRRFNKWILYSSAAMIAILLSLYLLLQQTSPQNLYNESLNLKELPSLVTRSDDNTKLLNAFIKGLQKCNSINLTLPKLLLIV